MSNLPSIFNRNSMTSNPMRDLLSIQRRMKEKLPPSHAGGFLC
jgi:hypothetical protein